MKFQTQKLWHKLGNKSPHKKSPSVKKLLLNQTLAWSFEVGMGVQILLKLIARQSILLYNFFLEIWNDHHPSPCFPTSAPFWTQDFLSGHKTFSKERKHHSGHKTFSKERKSIINPGATISTLGDVLHNQPLWSGGQCKD